MTRQTSVARQILVAAILLAAVVAIAAGGSLATTPNVEGWYADAVKAPWNPPTWVFGPAWSVLYLAIAIAGFLFWRSNDTPDGRRRSVLTVYVVQLSLNAAWTPIFFGGYPLMGEIAWWIAVGVIVALVASVIWLIAAGRRVSRLAAWLLVPYLLWLIFATSLNAAIIVLN
ncbi:TspO/MBR family protein [Microbacterium amylolyticum]|uniref:Tryptophan-rich sensory protein n=1 Tax=Microbacterium amylolyticum TaxID=936337 RepID=A0ABS4ZGR7_9MICO|nr:TspO/MBR family protein [Microbacterium amylolyticum]MBP2436475.1 tryptophan-rich sensory protein [Microbacterium amylolyticum]